MPQYMLVLGGARKFPGGTQAPEYQPIMQAYIAWTESLAKSGRLKAANKLKDGVGKALRSEGGQVVDGPFAESKETIGGYYVIEAQDIDEATRLARACPTVALQGGWVQVREVEA